MAQGLKHLPTMHETQVQSLGREDPLDKEMATHSSGITKSQIGLSDFTFTLLAYDMSAIVQ